MKRMKRWFVGGGVGLCVLAFGLVGQANAVVVGPHNIQQLPTSATAVGGGPSFDWLNIVNAPVTFNAAMTDPTVVNTGYANAALGAVFDFTFAGVQNNAGDDLVIIDSFDIPTYEVRTNADGFTSFISVTPTSIGVPASYFYQNNGPFPTTLTAAPIDLSALGVANGASVTQVRLTYVSLGSTASDIIALGALVPAGDSGIDGAVPEPLTATLGLMGLGVLGMATRRWAA